MWRLGIVLTLGLAGCDMGHLGNPLMWPVEAVGNGLDNATYNARRTQVEKHVALNQATILTDIRSGTNGNYGTALKTAMDLARVPEVSRPQLLDILKTDIAKFTPNTPQAREQLVVWFMVNGP